MHNLEFSAYFYKELIEIYNNENLTTVDKVVQFRLLYKEIFKKLTETEAQYFSSLFSRIIFILDKYNVPSDLALKIKRFRYFSAKVTHNTSLKCTSNDIDTIFFTLNKIVEFFFNEEPPEIILNILSGIKFKDFTLKSKSPNVGLLPFIRVVAQKKGEIESTNQKDKSISELYCETDDYGTVKVVLTGIWSDLYKLVWKGAVINLFEVEKIDAEESIIRCTPNTLVVLEPDYLVDATELAECFQQNGVNVNLYFLKKFLNKQTSFSMVLGNFVNYCFDELINNPEVDFEIAYKHALQIKPLQIFALSIKDAELTKTLKQKVKTHFENLKRILPDLHSDSVSVEPSFISPSYGLQGRLDILLEYYDDEKRKNIIELKSGSAPSTNISMTTTDNKKINVGLWSNHLAQTTCYNLLLDSTFENRTGSSQILYSGASEYPLRNAPNIVQKKQELMYHRNWIISLKRTLSRGHFSLFNSLSPKDFGIRPVFVNDDLIEFNRVYSGMNELERAYFHTFIPFIIRELYAAKLGSSDTKSDNGFSSLWKDSLIEKERSLTVLTNLELIKEESDFKAFHLVFKRMENSSPVTSLRKGDIGILYPYKKEEQYNPVAQQILKCSIKDINQEKVKISLRNKQFNERYFDNGDKWILEPDYVETTNKSLFQSLFQFLQAEEEKKELLLGIREPKFKETTELDNAELNYTQREILSKALAAEDYFLLQGPPGTGKTSYMLKAIVENIHNSTESNILVLAFTNRAVDEICSTLKKISPEVQFLRLGTKESSVHQDKLISYLAETEDMREVFKKVKSARIFVSTVSSILSNYELLEIKDFDIAIIDEASQILEPQVIGLLSHIPKFIMIGDEKQLPAIVLQAENHINIKNEILDKIQLRNLSMSLFERLLRCCKSNGWYDAFGMLNQQARMHKDIQEFPNNYFYGKNLNVFSVNDWQVDNYQAFNLDSDEPIEQLIASSRLIFIDTERENHSKLHQKEALYIADIIKTIVRVYGNEFSEKTVGIISPFRAQCAEIIKYIPDKVGELITVDTVERFQGSERDIIIMSLAVNHKYHLQTIQSLVDLDSKIIDRKLNVALTRAKKHLIVMGDSNILSNSYIYNELIEHIKIHGKFVSEKEIFPEKAKEINITV